LAALIVWLEYLEVHTVNQGTGFYIDGPGVRGFLLALARNNRGNAKDREPAGEGGENRKEGRMKITSTAPTTNPRSTDPYGGGRRSTATTS
jgi:hypothetical protein